MSIQEQLNDLGKQQAVLHSDVKAIVKTVTRLDNRVLGDGSEDNPGIVVRQDRLENGLERIERKLEARKLREWKGMFIALAALMGVVAQWIMARLKGES